MALQPLEREPDGRDLDGTGPPPGPLDDPARLLSLAESGLNAAPDPGMEHYAARVRECLGVPVSTVSLVTADQQLFPGMAGLPEPWASTRCTPLSHSLCQLVVRGGEPVVIPDARNHPWVADNPAVTELNVGAYAGLPLTDADDRVLGSLCAIDNVPRDWTDAELSRLADLARACSMELRLRLARYEARVERTRRDALEGSLRSSVTRTETLLAASQHLAQTTTVADVRARIGQLVATDPAPSYVGLVVLGPDGLLHRVLDPVDPTGVDRDAFHPSAPLPSALAVRQGRPVLLADHESMLANWPPEVYRMLDGAGVRAAVAAPLLGRGGPVGALLLGWDRPRAIDAQEQLLITSIASYAAQAIDRAQLLEHRTSVAHELQRAMLGDVPVVPGLDIATHYLPADDREDVGGDWYDVLNRPEPGRITVTVGDIVGHDLRAATVMGQVRSMLRQACWDRPGRSPAQVLTALEDACAGLGFEANGSAVVADLVPPPDGSGRWEMTWTNAGHPEPLVATPREGCRSLDRHDVMLGYRHLVGLPRRDHRIVLPPGSAVLLYTDGLVDQPGQDAEETTARLIRLVGELHGAPARELLDGVLRTLAPPGADDVALLALVVDQLP